MKSPAPVRVSEPSEFRAVGLVFAGGALGALVRYAINAAVTPVGGIAVDIFLINVVGAFLLALVVGRITGGGAPSPAQIRFRLFFGTGAMGGFTTYSTLAFHTASLAGDGRLGVGVAYALATLLVGAVLSVLGLWLGRLWARSRPGVGSGFSR